MAYFKKYLMMHIFRYTQFPRTVLEMELLSEKILKWGYNENIQ